MNSRIVLFFVTFLALALFTTAGPVPQPEAAVIKRALKQFDARAAKKREEEHHHKPSKVYYAAPAATA
ncbi:hypothetical protein C2E23DRAFT_881150 [Lenzites betulinus]|nr:hypothetical protein C2E23DRAFT_881150 [Lenzites betulinus]